MHNLSMLDVKSIWKASVNLAPGKRAILNPNKKTILKIHTPPQKKCREIS